MLEFPKSLKSKINTLNYSLKNTNLEKERERERILHADDMIVGIAGNMEPSAGIDKGGVPALQDMGGVRESASQSVQGISWKPRKQRGKYGLGRLLVAGQD